MCAASSRRGWRFTACTRFFPPFFLFLCETKNKYLAGAAVRRRLYLFCSRAEKAAGCISLVVNYWSNSYANSFRYFLPSYLFASLSSCRSRRARRRESETKLYLSAGVCKFSLLLEEVSARARSPGKKYYIKSSDLCPPSARSPPTRHE